MNPLRVQIVKQAVEECSLILTKEVLQREIQMKKAQLTQYAIIVCSLALAIGCTKDDPAPYNKLVNDIKWTIDVYHNGIDTTFTVGRPTSFKLSNTGRICPLTGAVTSVIEMNGKLKFSKVYFVGDPDPVQDNILIPASASIRLVSGVFVFPKEQGNCIIFGNASFELQGYTQ